LIIPDLRTGRTGGADVTGVLIASSALSCLSFALIEGPNFKWDRTVLGLLVMAAALGATFLLRQRLRRLGRRSPAPPPAPLDNRNFALSGLVAALTTGGIFALTLLASLYCQDVLGMNALRAGLILVPASIVSASLAPVSGYLTDKIDGRFILLFGTLTAAGAVTWMSCQMRPSAHWFDFLLPMILVAPATAASSHQ
jgi:nitrate/nitrite transporter NarK